MDQVGHANCNITGQGQQLNKDKTRPLQFIAPLDVFEKVLWVMGEGLGTLFSGRIAWVVLVLFLLSGLLPRLSCLARLPSILPASPGLCAACCLGLACLGCLRGLV